MSKPACILCGHDSGVNRHGECRVCIDWQKHVCEFPPADPSPKSMLDDINADLAELAESKGVHRIASLIADRWGLDTAEVAPYVTAVAIQVTLAADEQLMRDPAEAFKRAQNMGYYAIRAAVAAERIGWNQVAEEGMQIGPYTSASQLAADTFADTDEPSETEH